MQAMIKYERGCPRRVNHFLKVYSFAKLIAENEKVSIKDRYIIEIAALMHDCGIRASLEKFGHYNGKMQEENGPAVAVKMMKTLNIEPDIQDRVSFLIGHHHTYNNIDKIDYQILVEADFLVNIFEDEMQEPAIELIRTRYFKTKTGIDILQALYSKSKINTK